MKRVSKKLQATNLKHSKETIRRFYSKVLEAKVVDHPELADDPDIHACWLFQGGVTDSGYGAFIITDSVLGRQVAVDAHRLSYRIRYGEIPTDQLYYVNHKCDVRRCCRPEHLYLGTSTENSRDRVVRNRAKQSPLTEEAVKDIRKTFEANPFTDIKLELAQKYGVTKRTIENVINRKTWDHID